jgi:hypothetical protein
VAQDIGSTWRLSPIRSGAFGFALMITAAFALGTIAVTFMVANAVSGYATEVAVLQGEDRSSDRGRTIKAVVRRENAVREHQLRYLLVDRVGHYLAGSVPASVAYAKVRLIDNHPGLRVELYLGSALPSHQ